MIDLGNTPAAPTPTLSEQAQIRFALGIKQLAVVNPATNIAAFLEEPTSQRLADALVDENGDGPLAFANNGTHTNATLNGTLTINSTTINLGAGVAASIIGALGLGSLATATVGTGVTDALAINVGTSGSFIVNGGVLGTPSSGTLTNCSGLPISGVSGLGSGVATFLATPTSANLAAAVTDNTGTGALVFSTDSTLDNVTLTNVLNIDATTFNISSAAKQGLLIALEAEPDNMQSIIAISLFS